MKKSYSRFSVVGLAMLACQLVACGSEDPGSKVENDGGAGAGTGGGGSVITEPLLPFKEGNTWTYRVTDGDEVFTKVNVIEGEEPVGGSGPNKDVLAHRVTTTKKDGTDKTVSWQKQEGNVVLRYREQSFAKGDGALNLEEHWTPHRLRVDSSPEHTTAGASWLESYDETKLPVGGTPSTAPRRDRWTVQETGATVTVPAGTFDDAIVLVKSGTSTQKTYWFVPGVGKVKETGGQVEELVSYEVEP